MIDQSTISYKLYEDSVDCMGTAKVTLPDLTALTQSISGAGIAGNIEAVILGHFDAMTLGVDFRNTTPHVIRMAEPRIHNIDLRAAQQNEDPVSGTIVVSNIKHVMRVIPKTTKGGTLAPASPADASGEYAVRYWATYIDGKKEMEIDPLNFICYVHGTDYLENVRKALGM